VEWFKGKELAFALASNILSGNLGIFINDFTMPYIYQATQSIPLCLWIAFFYTLLAFLAAISLFFIHTHYSTANKPVRFIVNEIRNNNSILRKTERDLNQISQ
jgi:hypothetical protein